MEVATVIVLDQTRNSSMQACSKYLSFAFLSPIVCSYGSPSKTPPLILTRPWQRKGLRPKFSFRPDKPQTAWFRFLKKMFSIKLNFFFFVILTCWAWTNRLSELTQKYSQLVQLQILPLASHAHWNLSSAHSKLPLTLCISSCEQIYHNHGQKGHFYVFICLFTLTDRTGMSAHCH